MASSPATWPDWLQRVADPTGALWRVRTLDLLLAATQFHPTEARTIANTMGRFQTTIERPDGSVRTVYTDDDETAEDYHRRTVLRIMSGQMP